MTTPSAFKRSAAATLLVTTKKVVKSIASTITALSVVVVSFVRQGEFDGGAALLLLTALGAAVIADVLMAFKAIAADAGELIDAKVNELRGQA